MRVVLRRDSGTPSLTIMGKSKESLYLPYEVTGKLILEVSHACFLHCTRGHTRLESA